MLVYQRVVEIYPLVIYVFFHGILMECDGIVIHLLWDIPGLVNIQKTMDRSTMFNG
jgi:hypothetical protein